MNPVDIAMARAAAELKEKLAEHHEKEAAHKAHIDDNPAEKRASDIVSEEIERITEGLRASNDHREGIETAPVYEVHSEGNVSEDGFKGAEDESDDESKEAEEKEVAMKSKGDGSQKGDEDDGDSESPNAMDYNSKTKAKGDKKDTSEKPEMKAASIMEMLRTDPDVARGFEDALKERAPQVLKSAAAIVAQ